MRDEEPRERVEEDDRHLEIIREVRPPQTHPASKAPNANQNKKKPKRVKITIRNARHSVSPPDGREMPEGNGGRV